MGSMWGLQFSMLKFAALSGAGEINLLMLTLVLLALVFTGYVLIRGGRIRFSARWILFLVVIAFLGYVLPLGATLFVAPHIAIGTLSLLACLAPVVTILLALVLRSEPVPRARKIALALGLLSILLILGPELRLPGLGSAFWIFVALSIPLAYGIEPVFVDLRWPDDMTSPQLIAGEAIAAVLLILPIFLSQDGPIRLDVFDRDAVLPLIVFAAAGVVETLLYFYLIKTTGGVFVSFGTFVSLFAGVAWGMLLFSERHGLNVWLAILFLCGALFLASKEQQVSKAAQQRTG